MAINTRILLEASIIDANKFICQEDALKHMSSSVSYVPLSYVPLNVSKEQGTKKKQEF